MARKTIALLGQPVINEDGAATEAIRPGDLVSGVTSISKQASAAAAATRTFALEQREIGRGIGTGTGDADNNYASGDYVKVGSFAPSQRVYAWLASGQNVSENDFLEAAGSGNLRAFGSGVRLARALEDVDATSGDSRIRVEVY